MSKIIKAFQLTPIKSFDFREIDKPEATFPEGQDHSESSDDSHPSLDAKEIIKEQLAEAKRKAKELEKQGYEEGYNKGRQEGLHAGLEEMGGINRRLEMIFQELQSLPSKIFKDYREWLINTALAIAERIVGIELSCRPELLVKSIESLLAEAEKDDSLTIYLNPKDLEFLEQHSEYVREIRKLHGSFLLKPDPALSAGGCQIESDVQLLDASMETQFKMVREMLSENGSKREDRIYENEAS